MVTLELGFPDEQHFSGMKESWNALVKSIGSAGIFCSWEWAWSFWQCSKRSSMRLRLMTCHDKGTLVAIAPLYESRRVVMYIPARRIGFLGDTTGGDFLDYICAPGYESTCTALFHAALHRHGHDVFCMDSVLPTALCASKKEPYRSVLLEQSFVCPRIALPSSLECYRQSISAQTRYLLQRKKKKLIAHCGAVHTTKVPLKNNTALFETMLRLHRQRWSEQSSTFDTPARHRFMHRFIQNCTDDQAFLFTFGTDSTVLAILLFFCDSRGGIFTSPDGTSTTVHTVWVSWPSMKRLLKP